MNYSLCCPKGVSEILFSHDDCQSRIDSRNGSDPCTLISARVAYKILIENVDILAFSSNCKPLLTRFRSGNRKYDNLSCAGYLNAQEAVYLQQSPNLVVNKDVVLRGDEW
jgi:hypothetical protein